MTTQAAVFAQPMGGVPSTLTRVYTAPPSASAIIDAATVTNTSGSNATITLYLVPPGATPSLSYVVYLNQLVLAGETFRLMGALGQVLAPGGSIHMQASADSTFMATISGREIST
jgi:hypothetical protein